MKTGEEREAALKRGNEILNNLEYLRRVKLPSCGYDVPSEQNIDHKDPISCRQAAQGLKLHEHITNKTWCILRKWMSMTSPMSTEAVSLMRRMQVAHLDNARLVMQHFPALQALISAQLSPYASTNTIINLYNAATTFALPVLRYSREKRQKHVDTEDVTPMPIWPERRSSKAITPNATWTPPVLSTEGSTLSFSNYEVGQYATNVLHVLKMLSTLDANRLGEAARAELRILISKCDISGVSTGVRDVNILPPAHQESGSCDPISISEAPTSFGPTPQNLWSYDNSSIMNPYGNHDAPVQEGIFQPWMASQLSNEDQPSRVSTDDNLLDQLFQLDPKVWETLMAPQQQ